VRGIGALILAAVMMVRLPSANDITNKRLKDLVPTGSLAALAPLSGLPEAGWP